MEALLIILAIGIAILLPVDSVLGILAFSRRREQSERLESLNREVSRLREEVTYLRQHLGGNGQDQPAPELELELDETVVEDTSAPEITLVLGTAHDGIAFFFPQGEAETLAAIEAFGAVAIPMLDAVTTTSSGGETTSSTTTVAPATTTTNAPTTTIAPTTTTVAAEGIGQPPDGESCG